MDLRGKVAIVTGASRGIGRALSIELAKSGASVVLASKTVDPNPKLPGTLAEVKSAIEAIGGKAFIQPTDVRSEEQLREMVEKTASELGGVDILINNAGALFWSNVEMTPAKRFDLVMGVNARAAFLASSYAIPAMRKRGGGHIINMSPPYTPGCTKGRVAYMISKFGMSMVTEGLAEEVAADKIKVHSVWPVTMVESQATIGHSLGDPSVWRKAEVIVDATLALLTGKANLPSGSALYDEEILKAAGITDLAKYACIAGTTPPSCRLDDPKSYWRL